MGDVAFDLGIEEDLDCECELEDQCADEGCLARIKVGPCSAFNQSTGELDLAAMCTPKTATAHTPNFIRPLKEKMYRNSCRKQRRRGTPDCNIDIDFDVCSTDPAMKYLLGDCPFAFCFVPRADLYDTSKLASEQSIMVLRGLFIGSDWTLNNEFEEDQNTSRNYSCTGSVFGIKQWLDAIPNIVTATDEEIDEVLGLTKEQLKADKEQQMQNKQSAA